MTPKSLLGILKVESKSRDLHREFFEIAKQLFEKVKIIKDGKSHYRFTELEFYYSSTFHNDVYIYGKPMQLNSGRWFKHGSGLDLTFGNKEAGIFGGILIRGVYDMKTKRYINGCWNVLKEFSDHETKISNEALEQKIRVAENSHRSEYILSSTRIGLKKKDSDKGDYISRHYRFITDICKENKFREKTKVAATTLSRKVLNKEEINNLFGYKILK